MCIVNYGLLQLCEHIVSASEMLQNVSGENSLSESDYNAVNLSRRLSELCDKLLQQGYGNKPDDSKDR